METQAFTLPPASLTDSLYTALRTRIINGGLAQGEKVTENRIATEYAVGRPTAKACLERLIAVGLLRRTAHKSAIVPTLGPDDISDLFFSRDLVETAAVSILAGRGPTPTSVRRTQDAIEHAARVGAFDDQVTADIDFHSHLVSETGSDRLSRMHELILGEVHMTMGLYAAHRTAPAESVAAEHAAIMAAIDARDVEAAAQRMRDHLEAARERILARMTAASQPSVVSA